MKVINRKNKKLFSYNTHEISKGVKFAILLYIIALFLFILSVLLSILFLGEAPSFVAGIGISSLLFNAASMLNIVLEIYLYKNYFSEIRNMLLLQILLFIIWIFIV